jgi:hypothetical protein
MDPFISLDLAACNLLSEPPWEQYILSSTPNTYTPVDFPVIDVYRLRHTYNPPS